MRKRLPEERQSLTHKFSVGGTEGYVTIGFYEDGTIGELFVRLAKEGSTLSGLMDAFASMVSIALQYGVPIEVLIEKMKHTRYEPHGFTAHKDIHTASSLTDYIAQWLEKKTSGVQEWLPALRREPQRAGHSAGYGPFCRACHGSTTRNGSCWVCTACGETTGCS